MSPYSIILFIISIIFIVVCILIYKGNTKLIHLNNQNNVNDTKNYAKAFGKALLVYPLTMISSGLIAINENLIKFSVLFLIIGLLASTFLIYKVHKKYNY